MTDVRLRADAPFPPTRLSDALELALDDVAKVERLPGYTLDMSVWFWPHQKTCAVCMAGAVMAQRLLEPTDQTVSPEDLGALPGWETALFAIDYMRVGEWQDAAELFGVDMPLALMLQLEQRVQAVWDVQGGGRGHVPWNVYRECVTLLREAGL